MNFKTQISTTREQSGKLLSLCVKPGSFFYFHTHRTGKPVFMTFSPDTMLDINHIPPDLQIPVHHHQPPAKIHVKKIVGSVD